MAEGAKLVGIKDSWSLMDFSRKMGKPKRASNLANKETGETFAALMFPTPQTMPDGTQRDFTMVSFSSNLGEISTLEIVNKRDELQVVLLETGNYKLCKQGEGAWEDVNLF